MFFTTRSFSVYPLVNVYIAMERSTMLLMGKSTISTGPFSIAMLVHQRVIKSSNQNCNTLQCLSAGDIWRCSNWSGPIVQRISTHKCNQGIANLWRQHLKWEEWARRSAGDQEFLEFKMQPATKPWMRFHGICIHRLFGFTKSPYIRRMSYNSV